MTLVEAAKTGLPFRRPRHAGEDGARWLTQEDLNNIIHHRKPVVGGPIITADDMAATDWEVKEESGAV